MSNTSFGTVLRACFVTTCSRCAMRQNEALWPQLWRWDGKVAELVEAQTEHFLKSLPGPFVALKFLFAAVFKSRISHVIALYQVSSQNQGPSAMSIEAVIFPSRSCGTREMSEISRDMFRRKKWGDAHCFFLIYDLCEDKSSRNWSWPFRLVCNRSPGMTIGIYGMPLASVASGSWETVPQCFTEFHSSTTRPSQLVRHIRRVLVQLQLWKVEARESRKHTEESPRIMGNHVTECPEIRGKCGLASKQLQLTHTR